MLTIKPITDLRNTNEISELCNSQDEPIFITKNGYGDLVVMSIATYEKKLAALDLREKLFASEEQRRNGGKLLVGKEVFANLRAKHGGKNA